MFTLDNLKKDLPAGLVVFLVALPLCLGVALASGAPIISGIISGVIGGIVVGFISRSHISVSGPAAGLSAVVFSAIHQLVTFDTFLMAVVIAGVLQIIGAYLRAGIIANYIPTNVINGLISSIGIILILKQIPHAFGYDAVAEEDFSFIQKDHQNTFSELFNILNYFSYGAIIISILSLLILIYWKKTPFKWLQAIPSSLVVVIFGVLINQVFIHFFPFFIIHEKHLVSLPKIDSIRAIFTFPSFQSLANKNVWFVGITIAIIASLETLLNLEAVSKIDPLKRKVSSNRELLAQGYGNLISGLIGGIPVTSVIVRSSVNINAGAKTKMSTIFHGVLLVISILFLTPFLNMIPLSSLAAILLLTGYKLVDPVTFKEKYKKGWNQFIPFIATVIAIFFTDLLIGTIIGLTVSILFLLKSNYKNPFKIKTEKMNVKETITIELPNQVSFLNKASIQNTLWKLPKNSNVIIEAKNSDYIDEDILEIFETFKNTVAIENNIHLNIFGFKNKFHIQDQVQFSTVIGKEEQQNLSSLEALEILIAGNKRFAEGKFTEKYLTEQVQATSNHQNPIAVIVSCIDSRTSPELVFDLGIGDLISIRIAGNIINQEIIESIEFACQKIGTKLIVVLGHSNCGAVTYAVESGTEYYTSITSKIQNSIEICDCTPEKIKSEPALLDKVIKLNTNNSITDILMNSAFIKSETEKETITIVSGFYDTRNGLVDFVEF
jgi:MFS superfamily sulfate permease-like transporter